MSKQFWAVLVAIAVVLIGVAIFTNNKKADAPSSKGSSGITHHVKGDDKAHVTLVEYGDYECPVCGLYFPIVEQVNQKYDGQIQFQFVNFPLVQIHQNAFAGARAAEAADLQGKFWEMHDALYKNQDQWANANSPISYFQLYAEQIGINVNQFKTDFASSKVNDRINADLAQANKLGLNGTPTFFLDGKQLANAQLVDQNNEPTLDAFSKLLDAEIAKKSPSSANASSSSSSQASTKQ